MGVAPIDRKDPPKPRSRVLHRVLSDGSLTKKASLNAVAAGVDQGARMLAKFLVTPFLVRTLGDTWYGVWQVLRNLIDQAGPASGRPGEALKWTVAHDQQSEDAERKRRYVGDAIAVWFLFLPLLLAIGAVLTWYAPIWLNLESFASTIRITAAILTFDVVLTSLAYLPMSVLQGENLGYKRIGLTAAVMTVEAGLMAGVVWAGWGLPGLALAVLTATTITGVVYLTITRSQVPWFGIARPTRESVRKFTGLSWWFLIWNLVNRSLIASDVIVLGIAGGPALVTTYSLSRFAPQTITVTVATFIFAIMPGLGGVVGSGDVRRAARVRSETLAMVWLLTVTGGVGVILWDQSFLDIWVPGQQTSIAVIVGIVVMTLQLAMIRTDANIIDLTLNLRRKVLLGAFASALSAGLGWVLLDRFGIAGLVVGFIAGRAVLSVAYPTMIGRMLEVPLGDQVRAVIRPGIATIVLFAGAAWLADIVHAGSWAALFLGAAASAVVVAPLAYFGGLSRASRGQVWNRVRRAAKLR